MEHICQQCARVCKSKAGLVAHLKSHSLANDQPANAQSLTCQYCPREFNTKIGLGQHMRHAHPNEANVTKLASFKVGGTRWSNQESAALLRIASNLAPSCTTRNQLHQSLLPHFPGRSITSIKTRLHVLNWKENETTPSPRMPSSSPPEPVASRSDDYYHWFNGIAQTTIEQLQDNHEVALRSDDLLSIARSVQSGSVTVSQLLSLLDLHATSTFPYKWRATPTKQSERKQRVYSTKKQIRRANYAALQTLYHHRKKDAATAVLNGSWRVGYKATRGLPPNSESKWRDILSTPAHQDQRTPRFVVPTDWSLIDSISPDEVTAALKDMGNSAPGLDKLLPTQLRKMKPCALAGYFNLLLLAEGCPAHLCRSRITLVPKVPNPTDPEELRPIAVSSVIVRLFHKILANRWNTRLKLPALQFAFLKRDGCLEATSTLHAILRHSSSTASNLAMAFVDVSKAFDSVSHDTIIRSARAFGAPPPLVQYLSESYSKSTAVIQSRDVATKRGVRQGDPLSSLLFIMAMDEVISLSMPELGYQFHDTLVDGFAYADDLILLAENTARLKEKLAAASSALHSAGMRINPKKTNAVIIRGDHRTTAVCDDTLNLAGETIHPMHLTDTFTYLGIPFTCKGKAITKHREQLHNMLAEIRQAPLKPHQRIELTRQYMLPKLTHSLVLGKVHRNTLKKLDNSIRQAIRLWLRLPHDTPNGYFYTAINSGGLGLSCLSTTIPLQRKSRLEKLLAAQCPVLRNVVKDPSFGPVLRDANIPVRVNHTIVSSKQEAASAWHSSLVSSADGRGLREMASSPLSSRWLLHPERVFPRIYIRAIHLRCNLMRTKVRSSRGRRGDQSVLCRGNCGQPESLAHILQSCWITHDARCARHNRVAKDLARRLRTLGYTVLEEPRVPTATSFIKPDLIAVRGEVAVIMDVTIVGDNRSHVAYEEKIQKYGTEAYSTAIKSALTLCGLPVTSLIHQPVVLSYRGILFCASAKALLRLGVQSFVVSDLSLLTITGSLRVYDTFMRGTWH